MSTKLKDLESIYKIPYSSLYDRLKNIEAKNKEESILYKENGFIYLTKTGKQLLDKSLKERPYKGKGLNSTEKAENWPKINLNLGENWPKNDAKEVKTNSIPAINNTSSGESSVNNTDLLKILELNLAEKEAELTRIENIYKEELKNRDHQLNFLQEQLKAKDEEIADTRKTYEKQLKHYDKRLEQTLKLLEHEQELKLIDKKETKAISDNKDLILEESSRINDIQKDLNKKTNLKHNFLSRLLFAFMK